MEKIERYLNHACHGIAGPRTLREHLRRELREHLLDAAAQHQAAGLSEDDALDRALEDFGPPDLVRSDLEATHGHRLMTVVLDKALLWKEKTMKARWLWISWAYAALALTVAFELVFILGVVVFLFPKYQQMINEGSVVDGANSNGVVTWSVHYLMTVRDIASSALLILIPLAIAWFLFEWRVRTENKGLIRLSFMGTTAAALMVAVAFTAAAISLPFLIVLNDDSTSDGSEQFVMERLDALDHSVDQLDHAVATRDWNAIHSSAQDVTLRASTLPFAAATVVVLSTQRDKMRHLRADQRNLKAAAFELQVVANAKDLAAVEAALQKFHAAYDPIHRYPLPDTAPAATR